MIRNILHYYQLYRRLNWSRWAAFRRALRNA